MLSANDGFNFLQAPQEVLLHALIDPLTSDILESISRRPSRRFAAAADESESAEAHRDNVSRVALFVAPRAENAAKRPETARRAHAKSRMQPTASNMRPFNCRACEARALTN